MSLPDWVKEWTYSTDDEVESVHPAPPERLRKVLVDDTASTDEELLAFSRRLRTLQPPPETAAPSWPIYVGAGAALAATALLLVPALPPLPELGPLALEAEQRLELGDEIEVAGIGELTLTERQGEHYTVRLDGGMARFDASSGAELTVQAAQLIIEPLPGAARFDVQTFDSLVHLDVRAGSLLVRQGTEQHRIGAGENWSSALAVASADFAPPAPLAVAEGVTWVVTPDPSSLAESAEFDQASDTISLIAPEQPPSPAVIHARPIPQPNPQLAIELSQVMNEWEQGSSDPDELYARLTRLLADNPQSTADAEIRALRLEVEQEVHEPLEVIRHIDLFLAMYPTYPNRLAYLRMRATLARDGMQDCERALPTYRRLAQEDSGQHAIEALAWQGLCAMEEGQTVEAIRALGQAKDAGLGGELGAKVAAALEQLDVGP